MDNHSTGVRKRCAFCTRNDQKISNEHAWPTWIRDYLQINADYFVHMRRGQEQTFKSWSPRDDLGVKVNDFCKGCNSGWMNDLETAVRPFLAPMIESAAPTRLDAPQVTKLVAWIVKTAMVFDFLSSLSERAFDAGQREAFKKRPMPNLQGLIVWCSAYSGSMLTTATATRLRFNDSKLRMVATAQTLSAGHFAFQVLTYEPEKFPPLGIWLPDPPIADDRVVRLWPLDMQTVQRDPVWPPTMTLDDAGLIELRTAWDRPMGGSITGRVAQSAYENPR